jgi:hypothetical protein
LVLLAAILVPPGRRENGEIGTRHRIRLRKATLDGRQRTWAALSREGRRDFVQHVKALQALAKVAE